MATDPFEISTEFLKSFGDDFETFDHKGFLQAVIHIAADQAPGKSNKLIKYVVDLVFFPSSADKKKKSLWDQIEGKVSNMVDHKVDDAVQQALGELAASNLIKRIRNFGNLFRQLAFISNAREKRLHLIVLTSEANTMLAELNNVPPLHLLQVARLMQVLAVTHIAVLMELKAMEPHTYRHQAALNNMAILYSDSAASMFHRSMAWRRSMIASGKGEIHYRDGLEEQEVLKAKTKVITMTVYDRFAQGRWSPGLGKAVIIKETPRIPVDRGQVEFQDTKMAVYEALRSYDEKVQEEWTKTWNEALLNTTKSFMNLVDWDGRNREMAGLIERQPNNLVFPVVPSRSKYHSANSLERIDLFLEQQMDQFQLSGPRYVQTYRPPAPGFSTDHNMVFSRGDTYDTAMACIYFLVRDNLERAQALGDGLVQAMNHDPIGEGRIVAATVADRLIDPDMNFTTSIYVPDGGRRDIGNMSWAGIALTRLYHKTKVHRYLHAAETIGQWIITNCTKEDELQGFTGGEDHWGNPYHWRSVEHNVDCVSFFDNLWVLTGNDAWKNARERARTLVKGCFWQNTYYVTGTGIASDINHTVVPTDCQSWVSLARINPETDMSSLSFMIDAMTTESKGFKGTKFALAGSEVQNEATAGAAMSLWFARQVNSSFEKVFDEYMESLVRQIKEAENSIGYGLVATPAKEAHTGEGLGWAYFNYLHVASTAWTGLALIGKDNEEANPYFKLSAS
ncbi:MAG: hypothetical protein JJ978_11760 [Roseivirga sp.]|jgi:hypothetical protein|uniref:hypothetical protein n=1 Tax=Roseivirga sp. TaxID=1964215 RepID=UPI001B2BEB14|nr:hypothetical protein [Roseivirga sp.]MBO6496236.1 hypothetical protein [Roseivirga sp.]